MSQSVETAIRSSTEEPEVLESASKVASDAASGSSSPVPITGVVVGTIVGFAADGAVPLVTYPGQPGTAAMRAMAILDLHAAHIGRRAVLMFEDGAAGRPVILGCVFDAHADTTASGIGQVEIESDGERLMVTAQRQIVLRCGKASITLTSDGKIIVQGTYVSNRSSGVMRIKAGAVHIN